MTNLKEDEALRQESQKTGRLVLFSLLGFFIFFSSVNAFFITMALKSHTGVVVENAYEIGLNYNKILKAAKEQTEKQTKPAINP